ncbi:MAG: type II toxin-antitoxin system Phd/YefM family antitoxin [Verrucomicrobia bacterium]|jgi:antitoxin (DNA-binding transcriptional repressor) of toxin-antitoxin stability system|nr:type II toxin-antitoxin system Phd/YefM family antitoxin [Verrucomicrobiota bacterium]
MKAVGLYDAKTKLSALVAQVETSGNKIALTRHGKIVAELCPASHKIPKSGCLKSKDFFMSDDFDVCEDGFEDFWNDIETQSIGTK